MTEKELRNAILEIGYNAEKNGTPRVSLKILMDAIPQVDENSLRRSIMYLKDKGFTRHIIPDTCPDCYTLEDFCREHPNGTFIVVLSGHVVTVVDGKAYDSWDSSCETVIYYWSRKEE